MATYRDAGVDLDAADRLVAAIAGDVRSTWNDAVVGAFGGFAAGVRMPPGYERPVLMMTTDGIGTKAELAAQAGRYDGVGHDLVAMCVDDLAAAGARPLALVDYLAVGAIDAGRDAAIVASVASGCRLAGCALVGGEVAVHPGVLDRGRFDLAGAALGVIEEGSQLTGAGMAPGDTVVAVASPNVRANGFSLIRHAVLPRLDLAAELAGTGAAAAEVLLAPSVIYAPAVLAVIGAVAVRGLAHITGGGLAGNVPRVLPDGCRAVIDRATWTPPPVFEAIAVIGEVGRAEMFAAFNMGVGFVAVVPPGAAAEAIAGFAEGGHQAWVAGEIVAGDRGVELA